MIRRVIYLLLMASVTVAACSSGSSSPDAETREVEQPATTRTPDVARDIDLPVELPLQRSVIVRAELEAAKALWRTANITSYRVQASETRNVWRNGCVWVAFVTDGGARQVPVPDNGKLCETNPVTVEDLYESVERLVVMVERNEMGPAPHPDYYRGPDLLEVVWNETGVPISIEFNLMNSVDEEMLRIVEFTLLG